MKPTGNDKKRKREIGDDELNSALENLEQYAAVLRPEDAKEPILAPIVRDEVMNWMRELQYPGKLAEVGLKPRRKVMLVGPPGTGKTTLAHHVASRFKMPLVSIQSEDVIDSYIGSTGKNLGRVFDLISEVQERIVVLWDEIDSIASKRTYKHGADQERSQYVNVMLRRFELYQGISMAATNREDAIDPAMWRRFEMHLTVALPGEDERFAIFKRYMMPYDMPDEAVDAFVGVTRNASPAMIEALMNNMKRRLVMAPLINKSLADPFEIIAGIVSSIKPPSEAEGMMVSNIPLWADKAGSIQKVVEGLADGAWPPKLAKGE